MSEFWESYHKIGESDREFDVAYWQSKGTDAIINAALQMVQDYLFFKEGQTGERRLDRTIESLRKL